MYCSEENFGSKKLWRMDLTADLAKKSLVNLAKSLAQCPQMGSIPKSMRVAQKYSCNCNLEGD